MKGMKPKKTNILSVVFLTLLGLPAIGMTLLKLKSTIEYNSAKDYCKSIEPLVDRIAGTFNLEKRLLLPIVFPECMRFSGLQNRIETNALELFYTNFGKDYSDFSIGRFQMKPSFVEALELSVLQDKELRKEFKFLLMQEDCKGVRTLRLERLKDINWQIIYLCCFYKVADKRFGHLSFHSLADKVHFYATAYNLGFTSNIDEITKWQTINSFPSGKRNDEKNYPYGYISKEYFNEINH